MTAYENIKASMKALLITTPLQKISVEDISCNAYVSRKTFYKYFSNKFDLLDKIFVDDIFSETSKLRDLLPINNKETTLLVLERFYKCFYNNKDFYCQLVKYKGRHWFREHILSHILDMNTILTKKYADSLSPIELDYMSYYFAASQTMLLIKWLQEDCPITPEQMATNYSKWAISYWFTLES